VKSFYLPDLFVSSTKNKSIEMKMLFLEDESVKRPFIELHVGEDKGKYMRSFIGNDVLMDRMALNYVVLNQINDVFKGELA